MTLLRLTIRFINYLIKITDTAAGDAPGTVYQKGDLRIKGNVRIK